MQADLEKLYAQLTATLEAHGASLPDNLRSKLAIAKVYLGDFLDEKFPILARSLLLKMVEKN